MYWARCSVITRRTNPIRATTINATPVTTRTVTTTNATSPVTRESTRSAPANQVRGANGPVTAAKNACPIEEAVEPASPRVGCSMARDAWLMVTHPKEIALRKISGGHPSRGWGYPPGTGLAHSRVGRDGWMDGWMERWVEPEAGIEPA